MTDPPPPPPPDDDVFRNAIHNAAVTPRSHVRKSSMTVESPPTEKAPSEPKVNFDVFSTVIMDHQPLHGTSPSSTETSSFNRVPSSTNEASQPLTPRSRRRKSSSTGVLEMQQQQPKDDEDARSVDSEPGPSKPHYARHRRLLSNDAVTHHFVFDRKPNLPRVKVSKSGPSVRRDLNYQHLERSPGETTAMGPFEMVRRKCRHLCHCLRVSNASDDDNDETPSITSLEQFQYHIPPPQDESLSLLHGIKLFFSQRFRDLLLWKFRASFGSVMLVLLTLYILFTVLFSLVLYAIIEGKYRRDGWACIEGWEDPLATTSLKFELAFELSWTTFSTVGYGSISPSVMDQGCYGIRYACAIEAFLGVLYAGYSSAIFFAKVLRMLGEADVQFSSTILIQYGPGVKGEKGGPVNNGNRPRANSESLEDPFPIAEFRIVNTRANQKECEILNASISCIASSNVSSERGAGSDSSNSFRDATFRDGVMVIDDSTGSNERVPLFKRKFQKLTVQVASHPYFKKVWYVRHVLDARSPLLKSEVKRRIRQVGHWPSDLIDYEAVRNSLVEFNDIVVTLKGTSKISRSEVFAERRYKFQDVHIGWQFAGMLYYSTTSWRKKKKKLKVDMRLIHDILPQNGGGNEPIGVHDD